jgi:hypothetical protein
MFVSAEAPLVWGFIDAAHELILASDPPRGCGVVRPNGLANLGAARRCWFRLGCDTKTDPPVPVGCQKLGCTRELRVRQGVTRPQ